MNVYAVKLRLIMGEVYKGTTTFVKAENKVDAGKMALAVECQGKAFFDNERPNEVVWDMSGCAAYTVTGITLVPDEDVPTLNKHFTIFLYNEDEMEMIMQEEC
jgi:hypothetical protein